jgi:signal transduction histidine kinase
MGLRRSRATRVGVARRTWERIFRPFEQAGHARGIGLGLAISDSIARVRGQLTVKSEQEGEQVRADAPPISA